MEISPNEIQTRTNLYAASHDLQLEDRLGFGFDGIVYSTSRQSAVKVFWHEPLYRSERDVYHRLQERGVVQVLDFKVPQERLKLYKVKQLNPDQPND